MLVRPLLAVGAVLLAGCASSPKAAAPTPVSSTPAACPGNSSPAVDAWPASVPTNLPTFPGQQITSTTVVGTRTTITFTTPQSLRESVVSILQTVPQAGYVLGRGEAERVDAEAPFSDKATDGAFRVQEVDSCSSQWLLVLEPRGLFATPPKPLVTVSANPKASTFGG